MIMKVKVFKLLDSTELIAEQFEAFDQFLELKSPAAIILQKTEHGVGVALAPYMPYVEGNYRLMRSAIAVEGEPNLQMQNEYSRIFGSGIQIVPAGSI
jgi:hypothetical protein